jgi:hypothetical protein
MDRVLTDETRSRIMRGYRQLLAAPDSDHEAVEITEEVPLDAGVILLEHFEDNSVHAEVLMTREEHPPLVTDDVDDCPHHPDGDELSTLGDLGEDYAALEMDLLEVSALMCDLPEHQEELERYVVGDRVAFESLFCFSGLLTFTFAFRVADGIVAAYQDFEHELGEQVGIPIEPLGDELIKNRRVSSVRHRSHR